MKALPLHDRVIIKHQADLVVMREKDVIAIIEPK